MASAGVAGIYTIWLTAFLFDRLGPASFGTWATIIAILTPLLVLDAGLGFVVIRASASEAAGHGGAAEAMTAHGLYTALGLAGVVIGLGLGLIPGPVLGLSATDANEVRIACWVLSADFGLLIATSAFGGLLRGGRRYDALFVAAVGQAAAGLAFTVALVPSIGLIGAALAQLASHAAGRIVQVIFVRRFAPWFSLRPRRPRWTYLRTVASFALPLIVISIAGQISFSTDVIVVGAIAGASAAGWIAVGARLPALAVSLLSTTVGVIFPVFVEDGQARPGRPPATLARSLRAAGFMGGSAFLFLALARDDILDLWVPGIDPIASSVFAIYSVAWALHVPAHVLALLLISQARHTILAPFVLAESVANLVLSVTLVLLIGPIGAALGSLVAVAGSNGLVLPLVVRDRLGIPIRGIVGQSALGLALGASVAVAGWAVSEGLAVTGLGRLLVQASLTGVAGVIGLATLWGGWRAVPVHRRTRRQ